VGERHLARAQRKCTLSQTFGQEVELIAVGIELEFITARIHAASLPRLARIVKDPFVTTRCSFSKG
jgi:hypothetical protein